MPRKVAQVLVVVQAEVPDRIVYLGGAVDNRVVRMCKMDQVDSVLLGVHRSLLGSVLAVVDDLKVYRMSLYDRNPKLPMVPDSPFGHPRCRR